MHEAPGLFDAAPEAGTRLLDGLNDEQRRAVTLPEAHGLILAGAGSGKTRVLTTRIAWLLQTGQATPGGLLAVTFTNKAAKEMLHRLSGMLPINVRGMWVGTFHGLCNRFLRAHWQLASLPQTFQILDTQDQLSAIKRLLKANNIDDERCPPKELQWFISGSKEEGQRPKDLVARDPQMRQKIELYQLYEDQCQREGVVDFGELMLRTYEVLRDHAPLREHYQRRFRHILVDEFQDTNRLQYAWIKMLSYNPVSHAFSGNSVFAVGDDDQSIYGFRGAQVGNMADFVREYGVAEPIKLERNYRSHGNILDSANHLISHNSGRLGKNLSTERGPGEPVRVMESPSDYGEAAWLIDEMTQLLRDGVPHQQIAVLYRSNAQSRVIETALFNAGMPYKVYGGLRFFERAEIKHALAYLRLLENPRDDTSFLRVVNFPPRGIGARSLEQLQDSARDLGCALTDAVTGVTGKAGANLTAFVAMLQVMREQSANLSLKEIVQLVLAHSGLVEHYQAERDGQDRVENLEELVNAAESFVSIEGFGRDAEALTASTAPDENGETISPLAAFLSHASLEAGDNQAEAGKDAIQLMTVHAAKGLEFDAVFITGLEEGLFPHENSLSSVSGLEEERRLMYVAITRARQRLYLSHAQTRMLHGSTRYNIKSRFFDELPEGALKWLSPRNKPAWGGAGAGSGGGWSSGSSFGSGAGSSNWGSQSGYSGQRNSSFEKTKANPWGEDLPVRRVQEVVAPSASGGQAALKAGVKVFHNKFGEGKVLSVDGKGEEARAQVNFPRHGVKWLALSVAKLTVV
jgi:DNA helicase II / ATP-dependent DNA helicase PcrA